MTLIFIFAAYFTAGYFVAINKLSVSDGVKYFNCLACVTLWPVFVIIKKPRKGL